MSTLSQMASDMRTILNKAQKGYVEKALFGGLHVVMERRGETWRLAIARQKAWPSQQEIATVTQHFGLPETVAWERMQKTQQKGGQKVKWNVAECLWREPAQ